MICTFFGHRNAPETIKPTLRSAVINLIENYNCFTFYVGNNGNFDTMAYNVLNDLAETYPINFYVVSAYIKTDPKSFTNYDVSREIIPDNIESVPKKFAIDHKNRWMIKKADFVIAFVKRFSASCSYNYVKIAKKAGKTIINIAK